MEVLGANNDQIFLWFDNVFSDPYCVFLSRYLLSLSLYSIYPETVRPHYLPSHYPLVFAVIVLLSFSGASPIESLYLCAPPIRSGAGFGIILA